MILSVTRNATLTFEHLTFLGVRDVSHVRYCGIRNGLGAYLEMGQSVECLVYICEDLGSTPEHTYKAGLLALVIPAWGGGHKRISAVRRLTDLRYLASFRLVRGSVSRGGWR